MASDDDTIEMGGMPRTGDGSGRAGRGGGKGGSDGNNPTDPRNSDAQEQGISGGVAQRRNERRTGAGMLGLCVLARITYQSTIAEQHTMIQ
jgi:hypothetical protein